MKLVFGLRASTVVTLCTVTISVVVLVDNFALVAFEESFDVGVYFVPLSDKRVQTRFEQGILI